MQHDARPSDALLLHDGRAGNRRQCLALAEALGLRADEFALSPRAPFRWISPRKWPVASSASFGAEFAHVLKHPPRLAIGCGRHAALATRLLRERGARAVQILDPRIDPRHWDIVVAPEHDSLRGDNVINLLGGLHPVDDAWLRAARERFAQFARLPSPRTAVLLGGDSAHWRFTAEKFERLAALLDADLARGGGSLLVTASRRTPAEIVARIAARFAGVPHAHWRDHRDDAAFGGSNPYPGFLAHAERIVCTPDSVNMLSEACATRAPVHVFDIEDLSGRPRAFVDALLARGRIRAFDDALAPFAAEPLQETARVAAEVKRRLGP